MRSSTMYRMLAATILLTSSGYSYGNEDNSANPDYNKASLISDLGLEGKQVTFEDAKGNTVSASEFIKLIDTYQTSKADDKAFSLTKIMAENPNNVTVKAELIDKVELNQPAINLQVNDKMPSLSGKNLLGKNITIDFAAKTPKHQYTLISSYFLECGACIKEVPAIKAFIKQYPQVAVHYVTFESVEQSRKFASQHQINAEIISDANDWLTQVGISGYPTVILLNQAGELMAAESGYNAQDKLKFVEALLPPPAS